jgi:D-xylose transport system permease protein
MKPSRPLNLRDSAIVLALLGVCLFFSLAEPRFLEARNLTLLFTELAISGTLAMGMLLVILPGHIDLSVGSGLALMGGLATVLTARAGWPSSLAMAAATACSILLWWGMGRLVVLARIPAFIVTLAGMLVFRGLFWLVIQNQTIAVVAGGQRNAYSQLSTLYLSPTQGLVLASLLSFVLIGSSLLQSRSRQGQPPEFADREFHFLRAFVSAQALTLLVLVTNQFRGLPLPLVIFASVSVLVHCLIAHTPWGRHLYAIGGNPEAALLSGIAVNRVVLGAFALLGGLVALTGLMLTSYTGNSTTDLGEWMELDAVAACVIGGVSLRGGRGSVAGVLAGALIMATLLSGMTLMSITPEHKLIARGLVLLAAVGLDVRLSRPHS